MHERCSRRDCDERHTKWWRNNDVLKCMRMIDVGPFSYDYLLIYNSWLIERAQNIPFVFFFQLQNYAVHSTAFTAVGYEEKKMAWRLPTILPLKKEGMGNMISVFVQYFDRCYFLYSARIYVFCIFLHIFARWMCVKHILKYWRRKKLQSTRTHAVITFESN